MTDAAQAGLTAAGVAPSRIMIERFTVGRVTDAQAGGTREIGQKAAGLQVQLVLEGRKRTLTFDPDQGSILENARAAGMAAPFAFKAGVCATCRAKLVTGEVAMKADYGLSKEEVAQGYVLTCQAIPLSASVLLDYDG